MSHRIHRLPTIGLIALAGLATGLLAGVPAAQTGSPPSCFGKPATIVAGNGDSNIQGTNNPDVIVAGNGENDIDGKRGGDLICGGKDGDDVFGNRGDDKMKSGGGIDFIAGNKGDDLSLGGGGADQLDAVQDSLPGDEDVAKGQEGDDYVDAMDLEGNDVISGGQGSNDQCPHDSGDDVSDCES